MGSNIVSVAVQTRDSLNQMCRASEALGSEVSAVIFSALRRARKEQGASDDVMMDAAPSAFLAVWRNGADPLGAARRAIQSRERDALRAAHPDDVSLQAMDETPASFRREALAVAIRSAGLGHDDVVQGTGGGKRARRGSLLGALLDAPAGAAAVVRAVIADGLARESVKVSKGAAAVVMAGAPVLAAPRWVCSAGCAERCGHEGRWVLPASPSRAAPVTLRAFRKGYDGTLYAPLRVAVVAAAAGLERPRTRAGSDDVLRLACGSYGTIEALRVLGSDADPVALAALAESLAVQAFAYVKRDRSIPPSRTGTREQWQPDMSSDGPVRAFARAIGARANTGGKGRQGPACGQPAAGQPWGGGAGVSGDSGVMGGAFTPGTRETPVELAARRASARVDGDQLAVRAAAVVQYGTPCTRAVVPIQRPWVSADGEVMVSGMVNGVREDRPIHPHDGSSCGAWCGAPDDGSTGLVCGCGPLRGTALIWSLVGEFERSDGSIHKGSMALTHRLTVCLSPVVVSDVKVCDGARVVGPMDGTLRCGCGGKRGLLTDAGEHAPRGLGRVASVAERLAEPAAVGRWGDLCAVAPVNVERGPIG